MTIIEPHALKHGIPEKDIVHAWENYLVGATRIPGEREIRIGLSPDGREIEMVGALLESGEWLVYHDMIPPTKKTRREIEAAKRRL